MANELNRGNLVFLKDLQLTSKDAINEPLISLSNS